MRPLRLLVAAALGVSLAAATVPVATSAEAAGHRTRVIASCTKAVYAPAHYVFFCADGGAGLRHAAYTRYTKTDAHGHGVYFWNDCKPSCAGGTFHHANALFHLYRMRTTKLNGPLFTRIRVVTEKQDHVFQLPTKTIGQY